MTVDRGQIMSNQHKSIKGFEDLEVFKKAYKISLEVHKSSMTFPKSEQINGLADQMRRASKSICANIAEGYGKQSVSKAEFRRFILMAIGSADEMRVWIRYCLDLEFIDESQWQTWAKLYRDIAKMLSGLHKSWL